MNRKLNLGGGSGWRRSGWDVLDHDILAPFSLPRQAWELPYRDGALDVVFCSHTIEHVSHYKAELVLCEINRTLTKGGIFRMLTPDLRKMAAAYVNNDRELFERFMREDTSGIRTTLGLGQAFMNYLVSPGFDSVLLSSDRSTVLGGYAHVYLYDYEMFAGLLQHYGFTAIRRCAIDDSEIADHKELRGVRYDKGAIYSLIIECKKDHFVPFEPEKALLLSGPYSVHQLVPSRYSGFALLLNLTARARNFIRWMKRQTPAPLRRFVKRILLMEGPR